MPNLNIKPLLNLTTKQWKALIARTMEREGGRMPTSQTKPLINLAMREMEPEATETVGRLMQPPKFPGENPKMEMLPIAEARAKYFANPDAYIPGQAGPPAKEMRFSGPQPATDLAGLADDTFARDEAISKIMGSSPLGEFAQIPPEVLERAQKVEDLARGISMKRTQIAPIVPPNIKRAQSTLERDYEARGIESALARQGQDVTGLGIPVKQQKDMLAKTGLDPSKAVDMPPVSQRVQLSLVADQMWKDLGGARSMAGKFWEQLRKSSRESSHISNGRDYFISSFARWKEDPANFVRKHPREGKILQQLWDSFQGSLGEV